MKKLGKLELNQMSKSEMEKRELSKLMGGKIGNVVAQKPLLQRLTSIK